MTESRLETHEGKEKWAVHCSTTSNLSTTADVKLQMHKKYWICPRSLLSYKITKESFTVADCGKSPADLVNKLTVLLFKKEELKKRQCNPCENSGGAVTRWKSPKCHMCKILFTHQLRERIEQTSQNYDWILWKPGTKFLRLLKLLAYLRSPSSVDTEWWMGSYSGTWKVCKQRQGGKSVPWRESIERKDIIKFPFLTVESVWEIFIPSFPLL